MCLEATWHNGGSLARTLYSSLYMMQRHRTTPNPTLAAFCSALEATCAEVNQLIFAGGVCEVRHRETPDVGRHVCCCTLAASCSW